MELWILFAIEYYQLDNEENFLKLIDRLNEDDAKEEYKDEIDARVLYHNTIGKYCCTKTL